MSAPAIDDFRALLAQFRTSDLRDLWARAGEWSVFLAKANGSAHPQEPAPSAAASAVPKAEMTMTAPHLGLVSNVLPPASAVAAGERVADLLVLDETRPVLADRAGVIGERLADDGALVEFGQAILTLG